MLSQTIIRKAKPKDRRYILWDQNIKGLGLRVSPSGYKCFVLSYRSLGGGRSAPKRLAKLAPATEISLAQARHLASQELASIRMMEPDILHRRKTYRESTTLQDVGTLYFQEYVPKRIRQKQMKASTVTGYQYLYRKYLLPALGHLPIAAIRRAHIERMLADQPLPLRNRTLRFTNTFFNLCTEWELIPQGTNPCYSISALREFPRDRTFTDQEMQLLSAKLAEYETVYPAPVAALRIACLTGLRIGEILSMRWEHVNLDTGRLLLPDSKSGRRWHDLPSSATQLLQDLGSYNEWVFSLGRTHLRYRYVLTFFRRCVTEANIDQVCIHDIRRTYITRAAATGLQTHILRDILGHRSPDTADRYIRHIGSPVRHARQHIGNDIATLMNLSTAPKDEDPPSQAI